MTHPVRRRILHVIAVVAGVVAVVEACGPHITFRAYLPANFWQPFRHRADDLAKRLPSEKQDYAPYAGIARAGTDGAMARLRDAYENLLRSPLPVGQYEPLRLIFPDQELADLRDQARMTSPANAAEGNELDLLRCKIELRAARGTDDPSLAAVQSCFQAYLQQPRPAALKSEARGWLGRTYFLRGNHVEAAKIYLDELESPDSNIKRERLVKSLRLLHNSSPNLIPNGDLTPFFDTPSHALFIADVVTNMPAIQAGTGLVVNLINGLEQHKDLFQRGAQSDALALMQMRASLRIGDANAALSFSNLIPAASPVRRDAEYLWLVGTAHYLKADYNAAERAFLSQLNSSDASASERARAGQALEGVYEKMRRPVDQLWAALRVAALSNTVWNEFQERGMEPGWEYGAGQNLDVAYLLDAQLTDAALRQYLSRYGDSVRLPAGGQSLGDLVRYALAVRLARREEFEEAAKIFSQLPAEPRATQMKEAARLFAATRKPDSSQALYDYADFLSRNSEQIFFNDTLWSGLQVYAFLGREGHAFTQPAPDVIQRFRASDRRLQDDQEEYWRAYKILNGLVAKVGSTPLGRQAAQKAISCLRRINVGRFGRANEIRAADLRLSGWLIRNEKEASGNTPPKQ